MYYIVPALTDAAGKCNIVFRENFKGSARDDYRANPDAWETVGHMNSRGQLIALDAAAEIYRSLKSFEPLMAGLEISKHDLEVDAFTEALSPTHPVTSLMMTLPAGTPLTMIHGDYARGARLVHCETVGAKPRKTDNDEYQVDLVMFGRNPDGGEPVQLAVSRDGRCNLLVEDKYCLPAKPLLVGHASAIPKDLPVDQAEALLDEKIGRMCHAANNEEDLKAKLTKLSLAGAHVCSVSNQTNYSFALNKEHAEDLLGRRPHPTEWLLEGYGGIFHFLRESLYLEWEETVTDKALPRPRG